MAEPFELGENRYGKSRIRLVTVRRRHGRHDLRDVTVDVALEGDFEAAHTAADNRSVIATDTMKNTVYALAAERFVGSIEAFGAELARHFGAHPQVARATITLREAPWSRIPLPSGAAPDAFIRSGESTRLAIVGASHRAGSVDADPAADSSGAVAVTIDAGLEDLTVLKTTKSAFVGFDRDPYTTLGDAEDRLMATRVSATWRYGPTADAGGFDFETARERLTRTLLTVFAEHSSPSVQASIWLMGSAMLEVEPAIESVRMVLPNLHHWAVDLTPFGLENRSEIFVATSEPHGLIDATVRRRS